MTKSYSNTESLAPAHQLLLRVSRLRISPEEKNELQQLAFGVQDWSTFVQQCHATYLSALAHINTQHLSETIPTQAQTALANAYNQILARNIRFYQSFETMLSDMNEAEIDCIPLKGIYLAQTVYKDLGLRHLSDIDILIRSKDVAAMLKLMNHAGWQVVKAMPRSEFENQQFAPAHPYTFFKNGITVELHTHLYNRNQRATISQSELWSQTVKQSFCGGSIVQFSAEMLLQHLCLHLYKHIIGPDAKLVNFCDIHEFICHKPHHINWAKFRVLCIRYSCLDEVVQVLIICKKYWNSPIPNSALQSIEADKHIEKKFCLFLTEDKTKNEQELAHKADKTLFELQSLPNFRAKVAYLKGYVFPRPQFMYRHFKLKEGTWLLPWYLVRVFTLTAKATLATVSRLKRLFKID